MAKSLPPGLLNYIQKGEAAGPPQPPFANAANNRRKKKKVPNSNSGMPMNPGMLKAAAARKLQMKGGQ